MLPSTPSAPRHKLFVLEDNVVLGLAANLDYRREFPFLEKLANLKPLPGKCSACVARQHRTTQLAVLAEMKRQFGEMPDDRKRKLKSMLSAAQVRVVYKTGSGVAERTF